jgi:hypothetical protein
MDKIAEGSTQSKPKRICSKCESDETYTDHRKRKNGTLGEPHYYWFKDGNGGYLCAYCYWKYVADTKKVLFKGRQLRVKESPRTGVCNWCRAVVGEINTQIDMLCKATHMNHLAYHADNPLKETIENCIFCHNRYHKEERQSRKQSTT